MTPSPDHIARRGGAEIAREAVRRMKYGLQFRDVLASWPSHARRRRDHADALADRDGRRPPHRYRLRGGAPLRPGRCVCRRRLCRGDPQHAAAGAALHRLLRPARRSASGSTRRRRRSSRCRQSSAPMRPRSCAPASRRSRAARSRPAVRSASPAARSSAMSCCSRR